MYKVLINYISDGLIIEKNVTLKLLSQYLRNSKFKIFLDINNIEFTDLGYLLKLYIANYTTNYEKITELSDYDSLFIIRDFNCKYHYQICDQWKFMFTLKNDILLIFDCIIDNKILHKSNTIFIDTLNIQKKIPLSQKYYLFKLIFVKNTNIPNNILDIVTLQNIYIKESN